MEKRIRKAIIPAAGLGTRFLPATKSMPKEMLPIVDTPNIQYIVQECIRSGIEDILIITNQNKHSMENHFDINFELEMRLKESGKSDLAEYIHQIGSLVNIHYVRQKEPKGLGDAIMCAKTFVGDEPFGVLLGDDLIVNDEEPALLQLMKLYEMKQCPILGVQKVSKKDVSKYGIVKPNHDGSQNKERFKVIDMVEKPNAEDAPSDYAVLGRYILTPEIFDYIKYTKQGKNGEVQLTDALRDYLERGDKMWACNFIGTRYDIGDRFGFIKATIDFALKRKDLKDQVEEYIKFLNYKMTKDN